MLALGCFEWVISIFAASSGVLDFASLHVSKARLSPQTFYLITVEGGIPANYCTFLSDTLGYEEAIEGISMMEWQRSNMREVFKENR